MTAAALLDELHRRGVVVEAHGDRLRVSPATKLTQADLAALRAAKAALLQLLAETDRRRQYEALTADIGTPEDVTALQWLTDHGHETLLAKLFALDNHAHELIEAGAPEAEVHAAVELFVGKVREMRVLYGERLSE
jgi:hypothetical protein